MDQRDVQLLLGRTVAEAGGVTKFSGEKKIARAVIYLVLRGRIKPTPQILIALNMTRKIVYEKNWTPPPTPSS